MIRSNLSEEPIEHSSEPQTTLSQQLLHHEVLVQRGQVFRGIELGESARRVGAARRGGLCDIEDRGPDVLAVEFVERGRPGVRADDRSVWTNLDTWARCSDEINELGGKAQRVLERREECLLERGARCVFGGKSDLGTSEPLGNLINPLVLNTLPHDPPNQRVVDRVPQRLLDLPAGDRKFSVIREGTVVLRAYGANEAGKQSAVPNAVKVGLLVLKDNFGAVSTAVPACEVEGLVHVPEEVHEELERFLFERAGDLG
mgnify:CR=1 FL=1